MFFDTNFTFAGESSEQVYGLKLVRMNGGMIRQVFSGSAKVEEAKSRKWDKPMFYGVSRSPLSFDIILAKEGEWTFQERMDVAYWLVREKYEDFRPGDYPIVFKAIAVGQPEFYNNGSEQGYLRMSFRCDAPNVYSPESVDTIDVSTNVPAGTMHDITNVSNIRKPYYPEIEIELALGETTFSIENISNGSIMEMTDLLEEEKIYINGSNKILISDKGYNRVPNLTNTEFLYFDYGINHLRIKGDVIMTTRTQYPIIL